MKKFSDLIPEGLCLLKRERLSGIASGFTCLDDITKGWQKGETTVVAAAPGVGKTAFLYDCVNNSNVPTAVFTVGTPAAECASRIIAKYTGLEPEQNCQLRQKQDDEIVSWIKMQDKEIYIDDTPRLDLLSFQRKCREQVESNGVRLIVISGLVQFMTVQKPEDNSTWLKDLLRIAEGIKTTADLLHVPILIGSRVSEGYRLRLDDYEPVYIPSESDLYGGDVICPSADKIMLLHRPSYYGIEEFYGEEDGDRDITRFYMIKGFQTDKQYVSLKYDWDMATFWDMTSVVE